MLGESSVAPAEVEQDLGDGGHTGGEFRQVGGGDPGLGEFPGQDRAGFVVNALLVPYLLSAIRMAESGFTTAAGIDTGMELGCAHPMGPLKLADLIGLDTVAAIAESLYDEFREPLYAPPPLLQRMVEAGLLGRKTGRGFHTYEAGCPPPDDCPGAGRRSGRVSDGAKDFSGWWFDLGTEIFRAVAWLTVAAQKISVCYSSELCLRQTSHGT
ncbi:hypothetical protein GCM10010339_58820 [Streptomyces alanosinicus]|uniref:3-hydroxyacyl-CoA dehydrogenase C-terminal domain-containing protein n=1 Tax=Streptomyces alanosinicus TaxID=68171 RepID=A0A918YMJ8_9ACTN|nr:hypothetical protein GCM10010339_58820 [Streptomyces alanosinicus]